MLQKRRHNQKKRPMNIKVPHLAINRYPTKYRSARTGGMYPIRRKKVHVQRFF